VKYKFNSQELVLLAAADAAKRMGLKGSHEVTNQHSNVDCLGGDLKDPDALTVEFEIKPKDPTP